MGVEVRIDDAGGWFACGVPNEVPISVELVEDGVSVTVADARFAKPLDRDLVLQLAGHHRALITVEEGAMCGFGAIVLQTLAAEDALDRGLAIRTMHLPDRYIDQASPDEMYEAAGLTARDIALTATQAAGSTADIVPLGIVK